MNSRCPREWAAVVLNVKLQVVYLIISLLEQKGSVMMKSKQMNRALVGLGVLACVGYGSETFASPVAVWDFESGLGVSSTAANVAGGDLTFENTGASSWPVTFDTVANRGVHADGSSYTDGDPLNNVGQWETSTQVGSSARARTWPGTSFDDASARAYGFSVTIDEGYALHLSDATFDLGFRQGSINGIKVEYSTSSDFSNAVLIGSGSGWRDASQEGLGYGEDGTIGVTRPTDGIRISWNRYTNSGLEDADPLTGTVYFRITGQGINWSNNDTRTELYLDNLTINGQVVPEPASLALLGAGACLMLIRRRNPNNCA